MSYNEKSINRKSRTAELTADYNAQRNVKAFADASAATTGDAGLAQGDRAKAAVQKGTKGDKNFIRQSNDPDNS